MDIQAKAAQIRMLLLDVDGVLTNGNLYYTDQGEFFKAFHVHDGHGIKLLRENGIEVGVISGRESRAVERRLRELELIHIYQGHNDKLAALEHLLSKVDLVYDQLAYIGDDLPDLPLLQRVGLPIAVPNAVPLIKQAAAFITQLSGGKGAVREVCDFILMAQKGNMHAQNKTIT